MLIKRMLRCNNKRIRYSMIIAFSSAEKAYEIGAAMVDGFKLHHVKSKFMVLDFDQEGVRLIQLDNY